MNSDSKNNDDVKQHLLKIEERLDRLSMSPQLSFDSLSSRHDDEIDLREIWNILWDGKWWVIGVTLFFAGLAFVYAKSLPNLYKAELVLAPAQEQNGGVGGLAAQYGGLAAMAGISLGKAQSSDVDQAMALVKSWPFLDRFVEKYNIKPFVMGVKGWDSVNDEIIFDEDVYDPKANLWLREPQPSYPPEPTSYEIYQVLSEMLTVEHDAKAGLIRLKVEHHVPKLASEWAKLLSAELNRHFQVRDIASANRNIEYLREKIAETSIAEMQSVFYRMIESQMKTLMLAEVSDEYLLKTVVEVKTPEKKSKPLRALIFALGMVLGVVIGVGVVVLKHLIGSTR